MAGAEGVANGTSGGPVVHTDPTRQAAAADAPSEHLARTCAPETGENKSQNECMQGDLGAISRV